MSGYYTFQSKNKDGKSEDMYIGLIQRGDKILGDVSGNFFILFLLFKNFLMYYSYYFFLFKQICTVTYFME
jgi:hypothetical protein